MNTLVAWYTRYGIFGGLGVAAALGALVATAAWAIRRRGVATPAIAGVLAAGLVLGLMLFVDRARLQRAPGEPVWAHPAGYVRLELDRVPRVGLGRKKGWVYRLSAYSARTGNREARTIVGDALDWIGFAGGRAWMRSDDLGLHARDPLTLAIVVTEKRLADRNPALAGGVDRAELEGEALRLTRRDGSTVWLDAATLEAR